MAGQIFTAWLRVRVERHEVGEESLLLLPIVPADSGLTQDSPMQYLKKIRLTKARDLMMQENMKAYIAADKVGYESSSQFSREFKRHFGQSPADMIRELRTT